MKTILTVMSLVLLYTVSANADCEQVYFRKAEKRGLALGRFRLAADIFIIPIFFENGQGLEPISNSYHKAHEMISKAKVGIASNSLLDALDKKFNLNYLPQVQRQKIVETAVNAVNELNESEAICKVDIHRVSLMRPKQLLKLVLSKVEKSL